MQIISMNPKVEYFEIKPIICVVMYAASVRHLPCRVVLEELHTPNCIMSLYLDPIKSKS